MEPSPTHRGADLDLLRRLFRGVPRVVHQRDGVSEKGTNNSCFIIVSSRSTNPRAGRNTQCVHRGPSGGGSSSSSSTSKSSYPANKPSSKAAIAERPTPPHHHDQHHVANTTPKAADCDGAMTGQTPQAAGRLLAPNKPPRPNDASKMFDLPTSSLCCATLCTGAPGRSRDHNI